MAEQKDEAENDETTNDIEENMRHEDEMGGARKLSEEVGERCRKSGWCRQLPPSHTWRSFDS